MRSDVIKALGLRGGGGLFLVLSGVLLAILSPLDSWLFLAGLTLQLTGLLCLYSAITVWMQPFAGQRAATEYRKKGGFGIAALRLALIGLLIVGAGFWLWNAGVDMNEIRLLLFDGRHTNAQVIGWDIVPDRSAIGYVDYAYRASPTRSVQDRFRVLHKDYNTYHMGQLLRVTYAGSVPQVHRLGDTDWLFALKRALYWLLLLLNGAAFLLLPLWLMEFRRPATRPPL